MRCNRRTIALAFVVIPLLLTLTGCGSDRASDPEPSNATLDALLDRDPSAMSDALMTSGGWSGLATIGDTEYRVYEVTVDGSQARLYYKAAGGEGSEQGLSLYMYDVEPFRFDP